MEVKWLKWKGIRSDPTSSGPSCACSPSPSAMEALREVVRGVPPSPISDVSICFSIPGLSAFFFNSIWKKQSCLPKEKIMYGLCPHFLSTITSWAPALCQALCPPGAGEGVNVGDGAPPPQATPAAHPLAGLSVQSPGFLPLRSMF